MSQHNLPLKLAPLKEERTEYIYLLYSASGSLPVRSRSLAMKGIHIVVAAETPFITPRPSVPSKQYTFHHLCWGKPYRSAPIAKHVGSGSHLVNTRMVTWAHIPIPPFQRFGISCSANCSAKITELWGLMQLFRHHVKLNVDPGASFLSDIK